MHLRRRWDLGCDGLDDMNMMAEALACRHQGLPLVKEGIYLPTPSRYRSTIHNVPSTAQGSRAPFGVSASGPSIAWVDRIGFKLCSKACC